MWQAVLDRMLRALVRRDGLVVHYPDGRVGRYGEAGPPAPAIRLRDADTVRRIVLYPQLAFGEAYMDGTLTIQGDDLHGLLRTIILNAGAIRPAAWLEARRVVERGLRRFGQVNPIPRARANVQHHYDLPPALYDLFLDEDRQYSCAYFLSPDDSLEQAQAQKKAHIARKLLLEPGMTVLDIGCGWGGLALTLARDHGARVVGVTLSEEQLAVARRRAEAAGLADRVEFRLMDYREVPETFDRVVSVGMFEHVGLPHYDTYFRTVRDRLAPDGVALVHTIGRVAAPEATNPWIAKYIFPGGYVPTLSEVAPAIERSRLWIADVESLRLHYAMTLRHWFDRFMAREAEAEAINDARFVRMWKFYLVASEQTFRYGRQNVYQFQLSRKVDAVPITRDYLYADRVPAEARQAAE
jgi:cyclopropane-fatty-acyl-phospholipid synthase